MTEKRFTIPKGYRVIKDNVTDEYATFYDNDDGETFLKWLNELHEENQQLHRVIEENEKMIQSIYEELTKLRCIKENLRKIKTQWNWIMGSVDYD